jgi:rubrerythrin
MSMRKIAKLESLCHFDIDAIGAYEAALGRVRVPLIREKLSEFCEDHRRHIAALNDLLRKLGASPVAVKPDVKGAVVRGFTAATAILGDEAALVAMAGNEELTNRVYSAACRMDWSEEERAVIERHFADEQRHLQWIVMAVNQRPWMSAEAAAQL